jgi:quinol monooxygenase YgiN
MIIVTGEILARTDSREEVRALALAHVHRSRLEPGCISHDVHIDAENPLRFVFVERWADLAALQVHFLVPESRAFARALAKLAAEPANMQIYRSEAVTI